MLVWAGPRARNNNVSLCRTLGRIWKSGHQLNGWNVSGQTRNRFPAHLNSINKQISYKERSKWYNIFKMLHPISILTTFGWRKAGEIFIKWRNYLKKEGREKQSPTLNCSVLKTVALKSFFSVDTGSSSIKRIATPYGMHKHSLNSRSVRSSMDFFASVHLTPSLGQTPFFVLTNHAGRSNTPLSWHSEAVDRVRLARYNDRSSHPTCLLMSSTSIMQGPACQGLRNIARRSP